MSLARHTAYNLAGALVPVVVSLVAIPLNIAAMGETRYGVLAIFSVLLGYFGVIDFGLSAATAQRIASCDPDDLHGRRAIFWTGAVMNAALGLIGAAAIVPVAYWFFGRSVQVEAALRPEMLAASWWLALALPTMLLTGLLRGALQGASRFGDLSLITVTGSLASQLLPLAAVLWISPKLTVSLPALFLTRFATAGAMLAAVRWRVLKSWRPSFDRSRVADLFSFGGWAAITGITTPVMMGLDRFLIGSLIGARAVSHYSVPYQLAERTMVLPAAVSDAMFPRIAASSDEGARDDTVRALWLVASFMGPLMVGAILFLHPFLTLWISLPFANQSAAAGRLLMAGFWFISAGLYLHLRLHAAGRPKPPAILHMAEVVPYVLAALVALKLFGMVGAAAVFAARTAIEATLLAALCKLLREFVTIAVVPVGLLATSLAIAPMIRINYWPSLAVATLLASASTIISLLRLARSYPEMRHAFTRRFKIGVAQ